MAFIENAKGVTYNPGYFLADAEHCTRVTATFDTTGNKGTVTKDGTAQYVKAGTFYPKSDGETIEGIVYEDVDVSAGEAAGSIVTAGTVYEDRLAETSIDDKKSKLANITFIKESPKIKRPGDE